MPDISKCEGYDCPRKHECYRYTSPDSQWRQAYFTERPYKDGERCTEFLPIYKEPVKERL